MVRGDEVSTWVALYTECGMMSQLDGRDGYWDEFFFVMDRCVRVTWKKAKMEKKRYYVAMLSCRGEQTGKTSSMYQQIQTLV